MNYYLCNNCGFWQKHFAVPHTCPVCMDFRHTPPDNGFRFLTPALAAGETRTVWEEQGDGILMFANAPRIGIGPNGYLLLHPSGNIFFDHAGWYSDEAIGTIARMGGIRWLAASHPHAYGGLWQLQARFNPTVAIQTQDLSWTNTFAVSWPYDEQLALAPGVTLHHVGGHFAGQAVLHWHERGALFAGDMVKFHFEPDASGVNSLTGISTHKAFNRRIPMSHAEIRQYRAVVERLPFERVYTSFENAACNAADVLRLFDAQLAGAPFFGPIPFGSGAASHAAANSINPAKETAQ